MIVGQALTTGGTIAELEAAPSRILAVTKEQVDQAAKRLLREENSVTGLLLPEEPAR
jgi:zinc protease